MSNSTSSKEDHLEFSRKSHYHVIVLRTNQATNWKHPYMFAQYHIVDCYCIHTSIFRNDRFSLARDIIAPDLPANVPFTRLSPPSQIKNCDGPWLSNLPNWLLRSIKLIAARTLELFWVHVLHNREGRTSLAEVWRGYRSSQKRSCLGFMSRTPLIKKKPRPFSAMV